MKRTTIARRIRAEWPSRRAGHGTLVGARVLNTAQRRLVGAATALMAIALLVAVAASIGAWRADDRATAVSGAQRAAVLEATDAAVTALMNFGPATTPETARHTAGLLTDPLALDYRARGYDVIVAGAVDAGASVSAQVIGVGLHSYSVDTARVLVFVDQQLSPPGGLAHSDPESAQQKTPTARWATMRKVDGNWLLADLQPVGDITR